MEVLDEFLFVVLLEVFLKAGSDSTCFFHVYLVLFDKSLTNDLISILILDVKHNINTKRSFPVIK